MEKLSINGAITHGNIPTWLTQMYSYKFYFVFAANDIACNATFEVIASNYFSKGMLINRESYVEANIIETKQINDLSFPITSDSDISTCVKATNEHQQLQGIFTSSARPPRNQLSVEVILKNVDDCSSPAWNWFVESECRPGVYTECSRTQITQDADFTHCEITCYCLEFCDFLYLHYNRIPWKNQTSEQLCEVWSQRNGGKWPRSRNLYARSVVLIPQCKHRCWSIIYVW